MKPAVIALVILLFLGAGCASAAPETTPATTSPTTPAMTTPPPSTPSATTSPTFGQMARSGQDVYNAIAASCHGTGGQGAIAPALWGPNVNLARYGSAANLLDLITTTMPPGAAGSLSRQDYLNVLCFLLVQNNKVAVETPFDENTLRGISLK